MVSKVWLPTFLLRLYDSVSDNATRQCVVRLIQIQRYGIRITNLKKIGKNESFITWFFQLTETWLSSEILTNRNESKILGKSFFFDAAPRNHERDTKRECRHDQTSQRGWLSIAFTHERINVYVYISILWCSIRGKILAVSTNTRHTNEKGYVKSRKRPRIRESTKMYVFTAAKRPEKINSSKTDCESRDTEYYKQK